MSRIVLSISQYLKPLPSVPCFGNFIYVLIRFLWCVNALSPQFVNSKISISPVPCYEVFIWSSSLTDKLHRLLIDTGIVRKNTRSVKLQFKELAIIFLSIESASSPPFIAECSCRNNPAFFFDSRSSLCVAVLNNQHVRCSAIRIDCR